MKNGDSVPRKTREYLRWVELRHGQTRCADWLGTARQHVSRELPKVGGYVVALVAALGPDAAEAVQAAVNDGLRQFYTGAAGGLEPMSEFELEQLAARQTGGRTCR